MIKILFVTNVDWFFISHRLVIAREAKRRGWEVCVAAEDTGRKSEIESEGIEFFDLRFSRGGTNIIGELIAIFKFINLYRKVKPDIIHHITLKPVIYGSIVAKFFNINGVVNAISGLGYTFTGNRGGLLQRVILWLARYGFARSNVAVIFQNRNDKDTLISNHLLGNATRVYLIKGSGVDLNMFAYTPLPKSVPVRVLLPCRMLWDKGIREVREASDQLKEKYKGKIRFILVGMTDAENRSGVPERYLRDWADGDYVVWEGYQKDMLPFYQDCHIVVLPSYREGLPKTLIEACAVGRPIVTTDAIGCNDCVDEGVNGLKVPVRDADALALALEKLINNPALMEEMGGAGRRKAEAEFNVDDVVRRHLEIYNSLLCR